MVRGQKAAQTYGCLACHSVDGTKIVGPTWKGAFGKQEALTDGTSVTVDEAYLRASIIDPGKQLVAGYPAGVMPTTYGQQLSDDIISDIIAFIMSLK